MTDPVPSTRWSVVHPLLFAAWPVLDLYARQTTEFHGSHVIVPLIVVLAVTLALYGLYWLCVRNRDVAALMTTCTIVPFLLYGALWKVVAAAARAIQVLRATGPDVVLPQVGLMWLLATAVALTCRWMMYSRRNFRPLTRLANLTAALLVLFAVFRITAAHLAPAEQAETAAPAGRPSGGAGGTENASARRRPGPPAAKPDIYYLIFDRYASASTLSEAYEFDNRPFLERLRQHGFYVADASRCNYASSILSLWSSLNMRYHETLVGTEGLERSLAGGHEVGRVLQEIGYRYVHVWSPYVPTSACRIADVNLLPEPGGQPRWSDLHPTEPLGESSFSLAVLRMTPLGVIFRQEIAHEARRQQGQATLLQFELVESAMKEPGPKFVFAHFLLPHPPFTFTRSGAAQSRWVSSGSKPAYVEQLEYANSRILGLVESILAQSEAAPIIILQADEGPYLRQDDLDTTPLQQRRIRTGILNALLVPAEMQAGLRPALTPVNTFRSLFRECFSLEWEALADRVFIWPEDGLHDQTEHGVRARSSRRGRDAELQDARELGLDWEGHDFPGDTFSLPYVFRDVREQMLARPKGDRAPR